MQYLDLYNFVTVIILPLLVGFLSKSSWPGEVKSLMLVVFSLVAAGIKVAASGELDLNNDALLNTAGVIFTLSQVLYSGILTRYAKVLEGVGPVKDTPDPQPTPGAGA